MIRAPEKVLAVVRETLTRYDLPAADVMRKKRAPGPYDARLAECRNEIWWRIKQMRGPNGRLFSYTKIGQWFDRDHTTILLGVRKHVEQNTDAAAGA